MREADRSPGAGFSTGLGGDISRIPFCSTCVQGTPWPPAVLEMNSQVHSYPISGHLSIPRPTSKWSKARNTSRVRHGPDVLEGRLSTPKVGWEQAMTESTRWGKVCASRVRQGVSWAPGVQLQPALDKYLCHWASASWSRKQRQEMRKWCRPHHWEERGSKPGFWALKLSL